MGSLGVLGSSSREFRGEGEAGFTLSRTAGYICVRSWTACGSRLWQQGEIPSGPYILSSCLQPIHRHALPLPFLHKRSATDTHYMCAHAQSCLTLCDPRDCSLPDSSVHGIFQARIGMGCHFLLQGIFLTQESNPCLLSLLHWQVDSLPFPLGNPFLTHSSMFFKTWVWCESEEKQEIDLFSIW